MHMLILAPLGELSELIPCFYGRPATYCSVLYRFRPFLCPGSRPLPEAWKRAHFFSGLSPAHSIWFFAKNRETFTVAP
jgi:hypothetical protein